MSGGRLHGLLSFLRRPTTPNNYTADDGEGLADAFRPALL
jgi:hypothetical protein